MVLYVKFMFDFAIVSPCTGMNTVNETGKMEKHLHQDLTLE